MSNYTKEELEGKVKRELIEIAKDLNLDSTGNRTVLIDRIFEHKPSFGEMVDSAPVSKDGDLTIEIEEKPEENDEVDIGVEVNDAYPDQNDEVEVEVAKPIEPEPAEVIAAAVPPLEETTVPPADEKPTPTNMVAENTAEDILKGWQGSVQNFYRKNTSGFAPTRPAAPAVIAGQLGVPEAVGILAGWQGSIISRLRPVRGAAPAPPKTVKDMIQIIKSL